MSKSLKTWLEEKLLSLKMGTRVEITNNGEIVDEAVIKYKDFYISILYSDDEICSFGWSKDPMIFHTPIRDILEAKPTPAKQEEKE